MLARVSPFFLESPAWHIGILPLKSLSFLLQWSILNPFCLIVVPHSLPKHHANRTNKRKVWPPPTHQTFFFPLSHAKGCSTSRPPISPYQMFSRSFAAGEVMELLIQNDSQWWWCHGNLKVPTLNANTYINNKDTIRSCFLGWIGIEGGWPYDSKLRSLGWYKKTAAQVESHVYMYGIRATPSKSRKSLKPSTNENYL